MKTINTLTQHDCDVLLEALQYDQQTWCKEIKAHRNHLMILLMLDAGLRVGEVIQLLVADLIFNCEPVKSIRIRAAIAKNHKERDIPASQRLQTAIEKTNRHNWSPNHIGSLGFAFYSNDKGKPLTKRQVQNMLAQISNQWLGYSINPHLLRHTFASRLMKITSLAVVQQLLGHSSIKTTQIYLHPDADDRTKAINKI